MVLIYIKEENTSTLDNIYKYLINIITKVQRDTGTVVEILIIKDFN